MKKQINCEVYLFYEKVDGKNVTRGIRPVYSTKYAACADVSLPFDVTLESLKPKRIDLWIGFEIPKGYKVMMYPRSSLLDKYCIHSPVSIIDSDYSGKHVHVNLLYFGEGTISLQAGTRVAQVECVPAYDNIACDRLMTARTGGFGSTGV